MRSFHLQIDDWIGIFYVDFHRLLLHYLRGEYRQAVDAATRAKQYAFRMRDFPYLPIFLLYESLARLAEHRQDPIDMRPAY